MKALKSKEIAERILDMIFDQTLDSPSTSQLSKPSSKFKWSLEQLKQLISLSITTTDVYELKDKRLMVYQGSMELVFGLNEMKHLK